jgi:hypothetical protein
MRKIECDFNDCCAAAGWRQGMRRRPFAKHCWETNARRCCHKHDRYSLACGTKEGAMGLRIRRRLAANRVADGSGHRIPRHLGLSLFAMAPRHDRSDTTRPGIATDPSSLEFCRQKAEECLNLSYQIRDPKGQVAVLKLANLWMRLAESNDRSRKPH